MKPSQDCIDLIKKFEGFRLEPYLDSVNIPTIGFGSTHYLDGTPVLLEDPQITKRMAEEMLLDHLDKLCKQMDKLIKIDLNQTQTDSLISLVYNIGIGNFSKSTLLKFLNLGNIKKASEQILVWNKAGGKVLDGLSKRREAERKLFDK